MKRYYIETGPHTYEALAPTMDEAVIAAFKKNAPKHPGLLTRCRTDRGKWHYVASDVMLKRAGYVVNGSSRHD